METVTKESATVETASTLQARIAQLEAENLQLREAVVSRDRIIAGVVNSWSWRCSVPIRLVGQLRRRLIGKLSTLKRPPGPRPWLKRRTSKYWYRSSQQTTTWIVIATSSRHDVAATLQSISKQTYKASEVLVVIPDSQPGFKLDAGGLSLRVIHYADSPAVLSKAELSRSRSKYICCLTAGDTVHPTYLEKVLFLLEQCDGDVGGCLLKESWENRLGANGLSLAGEFAVRPALVMRTTLWQYLSTVDSTLEPSETWDLLFRCLKAGAIPISLPEGLHREHTGGHDETDLERAKELHQRCQELRSHLDAFEKGSDTKTTLPASNRTSRQDELTILLAMPFMTVGGAERTLSQIFKQLRLRGIHLVVITTEPLDARVGDTTRWFEETTLEVFHLPRFLGREAWPRFTEHLISSRNVQVLWIAGSRFTYELLPSLKTTFPELKVIDILFNPIGMTGHYLKHNYFIDHVVVEHASMKAWLVAKGEKPDVISVIPNGIDTEYYNTVPKIPWRQGTTQASENRFVVAFMGRLSEEKGPDTFIRIADILAHRTDIEFIVCGQGVLYDDLRQDVNSRQLENIHFLGFVEPKSYLRCCDVLVVCSRLDGRPNVVMESLAMGIPVIVSRVGAMPDMVQHGVNGYVLEPNDAEGFADSITRLATDAKLQQSMKNSARSWALENFSLSRSIDLYQSLFQLLTAGHPWATHQVSRNSVHAAD
jgi:O-antigen biosynthesis protein